MATEFKTKPKLDKLKQHTPSPPKKVMHQLKNKALSEMKGGVKKEMFGGDNTNQDANKAIGDAADFYYSSKYKLTKSAAKRMSRYARGKLSFQLDKRKVATSRQVGEKLQRTGRTSRTGFGKLNSSSNNATAAARRKLAGRAKAQMRKQAIQSAQKAAAKAKRAAKSIKDLVVAAAKAIKSAILFIASGGGLVLLIVMFVVLIAAQIFGTSSGGSTGTLPISENVTRYNKQIEKYAKEHGIPDYCDLIRAVMMQESGGEGKDVMQCSECPFNTKYPNTPNAITDIDYSINIGVKYLARCLKEAESESPFDIPKISLALQGYNCAKRS